MTIEQEEFYEGEIDRIRDELGAQVQNSKIDDIYMLPFVNQINLFCE